MITLSTDKLDPKDFPYGLISASLIDPAFEKDSAELILLAVGREGPPFAAKRFPLKDLVFPFVFEMTCDDLIFPYTPEAWQSSSIIKDTIAVTAILSSEGRLAQPQSVQRIGFATSDPTTIAGTSQRSSASMVVANKIDGKLYTAEEIALLSGIDNELDRINGIVAAAPASSSLNGKNLAASTTGLAPAPTKKR